MKKIMVIFVAIIILFCLFIDPSGRKQVENWVKNISAGKSITELNVPNNQTEPGVIPEDADGIIQFPSDRYPETASHIKEAIASGHSAVCTIDREGAEENRSDSLRGVETRKGLDRDEWPMAMCSEGGSGADIKHISPSDNRGAGAWVSNQLRDYPDGSKIYFLVE